MSGHISRRSGLRLVALAVVCTVFASSVSWGGGFVRQPAVGGVAINADGVLGQPTLKELNDLRELRTKDYRPPAGELNRPVALRMFSLREAEDALAASGKNSTAQMPDEIKFMAGLQRIQYVFIYPDDVVLAGPGEGWRVDAKGEYVGVTTGRPVLKLEDFLVALRTVDNARQGGITVSIDPTAEGRQRFEQFMSRQKTFQPGVLAGIEKALGPQQITITGVPESSNFARVLAASDYKMKRIAMGLEPSPLKELPSFLEMMKTQRVKLDNMMPRWWMACHYEPLAKSEDGLAWEIRGPGVKVMTEDEIIGADGSVTGTGKAHPAAQKWADLMTEHYDALAAKEPVFGDLRNLMDMCVVAALISKERMLSQANLELATLRGEDGKVSLVELPAPKTVATQCSFIKRDREYIITASGGVEIASWEVASRSQTVKEVSQVREKATPKARGIVWWN
jgi:hypothetical protein